MAAYGARPGVGVLAGRENRRRDILKGSVRALRFAHNLLPGARACRTVSYTHLDVYKRQDLRELARRRIPRFIFEYVDGGAEDEVSLRGNRAAFERLRLLPQTLVDTAGRHQRAQILSARCV